MSTQVEIGLNAVIIAVTDKEPRLLTVNWDRQFSLEAYDQLRPPPSTLNAIPFGPLDPSADRTLELALRGWVKKQTGLELDYVEQLYTFGDRNRDPRERYGGKRSISVAYLALVQENETFDIAQARWRNIYDFFPWEDWRTGAPEIIQAVIAPALEAWVEQGVSQKVRRQRRERIDMTFGLGDAGWDNYRVLDRYELLYEIEVAFEAQWVRACQQKTLPPPHQHNHFGCPMILDHRRILAAALGRIRGKLKYRPLVFDLLPSLFTLSQLQHVVEALAGLPLHKQNFRRFVEKAGLVESTGQMDTQTGGRPAALFRFRRDVLTEHQSPGVGLPVTIPQKNT